MGKKTDELKELGISRLGRFIFWMTAWIPISSYSMFKHQLCILKIIEGLRESDSQHYYIEKSLIDELKSLKDIVIKKKEENKGKGNGNGGMFG